VKYPPDIEMSRCHHRGEITAGPIWAFKSHLNHRPGISNPKVPNRTEPSDWEIEWRRFEVMETDPRER
jgi:hypothetical protein